MRAKVLGVAGTRNWRGVDKLALHVLFKHR